MLRTTIKIDRKVSEDVLDTILTIAMAKVKRRGREFWFAGIMRWDATGVITRWVRMENNREIHRDIGVSWKELEEAQ